MIYTNYVEKYMMEDISIFGDEDYEIIDKMVYKDNGVTLKNLLEHPKNEVLIWNKGMVIFQLYNDENGDKMCMIFLCYKSKDSKIDWDITRKEYWDCLKKNECKKVMMYTKINPEFWIKNYDFKLKRYEMELEL